MYMYRYVYFIFFLSFKSFQVGSPKGERNWVLAIVSPAPRTCLSPRQKNVHSLQPPKIFKVTVAIFDCSLSVIDQGGHVLIGKALDQ